MQLIKRIIVDSRGIRDTKGESENLINEGLIQLQQDGNKILEIREISKDSGALVLIVLYETKP